MDTHQLAEELLDLPKGDFEVSVDIRTGVFNAHGDEVVAKLFASSIVEVFAAHNTEVVVQLEHSSGGGEGVDVIEAVKIAQKKHETSEFSVGTSHHMTSIKEYASKHNLKFTNTGLKKSGGNFIVLRNTEEVVMSFVLVADHYQRIY